MIRQLPWAEKVVQMRILVLIFSPSMNFKSHVDFLVGQAASSMYALQILCSHGLGHHCGKSDVPQSSQDWYSFTSLPGFSGIEGSNYRLQVQAVINKLQKFGLLPHDDVQSFSEMCESAKHTV